MGLDPADETEAALAPSDPRARLAALRVRLAPPDRGRDPSPVLPLGVPDLDAHLPGGGMAGMRFLRVHQRERAAGQHHALTPADIAARARHDGADGEALMGVAGEGLRAEGGLEQLHAVIPGKVMIAVAQHRQGITQR